MRRAIHIFFCSIMIASAASAVPMMMTYQGEVEFDGEPFDGTGQFQFAIVNEDGSYTYWSNDGSTGPGAEPEADVSVTVINGLYTVILGDTSIPDMTALDVGLFEEDQLYLRIYFAHGANEPQMLTPDQQITAKGFAVRTALADDAATVDGHGYSENWETSLANMQAAASDDFHNLGGVETQDLNNVLTLGNNAGAANAVNLGDVGIGVASPSNPLHVNGVARIGAPGVTGYESDSQAASVWAGLGFTESPWVYANAIEAADERGSASTLITVGTSNYTDIDQIALVTDGDPQVFVDSNGNVGIGTTSPGNTLHVAGDARVGDPGQGSGGLESAFHGASDWTGDGYLETSWIYAHAIEASDERDSGSTAMVVGTSNFTGEDEIALVTSGNPQVFVKSDGKVGIGTTSPSSVLEVDRFTEWRDQSMEEQLWDYSLDSSYWQSFTPSQDGSLTQIDAYTYTGANPVLYIYEGQGTGGTLLHSQSCSLTPYELSPIELSQPVAVSADTEYTFRITNLNGYELRSNDPYPRGQSSLDSDSDTGFRIFMEGQRSILSVGAGGVVIREPAPLTVPELAVNGATEIVGHVGIGVSSPDYRLHVREDKVGYVAYIRNSLNNNTVASHGLRIEAGRNDSSGTPLMIAFQNPGGALMGAIMQVSSSSVMYGVSSDRRLQTDIRTTTFGLDELLDIQVVDYTYKDDPDTVQTGFLAQQLYELYPEAVSPGGDDPKEDPWMIDYGKLTPLIVKAMQDQQPLIDVGSRRLDAIEQELGLDDVEEPVGARFPRSIQKNLTLADLRGMVMNLQARVDAMEGSGL